MSSTERSTTAMRRATFALLVVLAAVRFKLAQTIPLFPDEAYYWDWSRHLAPGYFDHPPMLAWLIALGTRIFGNTLIGVRAIPVLLGVAATWVIGSLAASLSVPERRERARFTAVAIAGTLPLFVAGGVLATPDLPLLFFWTVALAAADRALTTKTATSWIIAGIALGLVFTSKLVGVLLPAAVVIACLTHPDLRPQFRSPWPWLAVVVALLVFSPVIYWNATHGWTTFGFQLGHGLGDATFRWNSIPELWGAQLGLFTPILFVLAAITAIRAIRSGGTRDRFFGIAAVLPILFFTVSALRKRPEANWPAPGYPAAIALLAVASSVKFSRWRAAGLGLAILLSGILVTHALSPLSWIPPKSDPLRRAQGWDVVANELAIQLPTPIATDRYQDAAEMAWLMPDHPHVFSLNIESRANQYDLWPQWEASAKPGDALILVVDSAGSVVDSVGKRFASAHLAGVVNARDRGGRLMRREFWMMEGWNGKPLKSGDEQP